MVSRKNKARRGKKQTKVKRWFVNATGWGFNLSLGSGIQQSTGDKVKRSFPASDNAQIYYASYGQVCKHDTLYTVNPLYGISSSATTSGRIADRIFIENISIRNLVTNAGSTNLDNAKTFRFLLIASTTQANPTSWASGAISLANVFRQFGGANTIALPDPQLCRVLCDETISLFTTVTSQQTQAVLNMDCPVGEWFEYQPGTGLGVAANLYFLVIVDELLGTVGTTNVGSVYTSSAVVYHN